MILWESEKDARAVVVIVHGAQEHYGRYRWLGMEFNNVGYHVVTGDLPGHGAQSANRGHIESFHEYIEEVDLWIKEAQKYKLPVFLLGHSMGGLTVIRVMEEKKPEVQAVLLSSPCLEILAKPTKVLDALSRPLNKMAPTMQFPSTIDIENATRNKEIIDFVHNDSAVLTTVSVHWYREFVKHIEIAHKQINEFPDVPLLLMQAGDDKLVDKIRVKEWFNRVDLQEKVYKEWSGLYHEIFNEPERDKVFSYAFQFFRQHEA